jgi:hypothetical protein
MPSERVRIEKTQDFTPLRGESTLIEELDFAVNEVNWVNLVRGQYGQSCQHRQCRQIVAAARRPGQEILIN